MPEMRHREDCRQPRRDRCEARLRVSTAVIVLQAKTNGLADLRPLVPKLLIAIEFAEARRRQIH